MPWKLMKRLLQLEDLCKAKRILQSCRSLSKDLCLSLLGNSSWSQLMSLLSLKQKKLY